MDAGHFTSGHVWFKNEQSRAVARLLETLRFRSGCRSDSSGGLGMSGHQRRVSVQSPCPMYPDVTSSDTQTSSKTQKLRWIAGSFCLKAAEMPLLNGITAHGVF